MGKVINIFLVEANQGLSLHLDNYCYISYLATRVFSFIGYGYTYREDMARR